MVIGIDASRAFGTEKTGTENYSYHLITQMLQLPMAKKHTFILFIRPNTVLEKELDGYDNVIIKNVNWKYLWTQIGLAYETWVQKLDLLWIPAHTLPVLRNPKVKTIVTIHGLEYRWLPEYNNLLQRWYLPLSTFYAAKAADRLICVSEATKRDLLNEIQIDTEKAIVIYEGVQKGNESGGDKGGMTWEKYGIKQGKYVLFVGTVQPRKNLMALVRAFSQFYENNPDYRLVIAGGIGWKAEGDLSLPEKLGIPEAVVYTGRVSQAELQLLYLGAKMYVQPSWTEGFGLPVLEAMKEGVPVIVSNGGALPEVVGDAGIIVSLGGILSESDGVFSTQLAKAMERIVKERGLSELLIEKGRKRASEMTWKNAAEKTLNILISIGC